MDYNQLSGIFFEFVTDSTFIDLDLTLKDNTNEIKMGAHKCIISAHCPYFRKMLTSCKEKTMNNITVEVPNAHVAYDIIMSFYNRQMNSANYPRWRHILESFIGRDFFSLKPDFSLLTDLEIPSEGLDLLLHIGELTNYHNEIVSVIIKNRSLIHNSAQISDMLYNKLISIHMVYNIKTIDAHGIVKGWNPKTDECTPPILLRLWDYRWPRNPAVYISSNNYFITCTYVNRQTQINVHRGNSPKYKYKLTIDARWLNLCFSPDNKQFAISVTGLEFGQNYISTYDLEKGNQLKVSVMNMSEIRRLCYSPDGKYIAFGLLLIIKIYDIDLNFYTELNDDIATDFTGVILSICYSPDDKQIATGDDMLYIKILDIETKQCTKILTSHISSIRHVYYSHDGQKIITVINGEYKEDGEILEPGCIRIWDVRTKQCVKTVITNQVGTLSILHVPRHEHIIYGNMGRITIWNYITGEHIKTFQNDNYPVAYAYTYDFDLMKKIENLISKRAH